MALNGISTLTYKRQRQDAKLEIAEAKRQGKTVTANAQSYTITGNVDPASNSYRTLNTLDATQLPTRYAVGDNDASSIVDNPNSFDLLQGRPFSNLDAVVNSVNVSGLTLSAGLVERTYNSDYFGDKTSPYDDQTAYDTFFGGSPTVSAESVVTSIDRDGTVAETTTYTLLGYFKPDTTGTWNFRINSDDGSYLLMGDNASVNDNDAPTNITLTNAVVSNGEKHAAQSRDGDFYLEAEKYYYMYAIFGNDGGPGTARFFFTKPGGSESNDFTGLIFYNTATDGQ